MIAFTRFPPINREVTGPFRLVLLIMFTTGIGPAAAAPKTSYDLILVAGRSNAVGYDNEPGELAESGCDREVLFRLRTGDPPPDPHDSTNGGRWAHQQPQ
jgi:hypothetical protein